MLNFIKQTKLWPWQCSTFRNWYYLCGMYAVQVMLILIIDIQLLWPLPRFSETNIALSSNTIALCFIFFISDPKLHSLKYTTPSHPSIPKYLIQTSNLDIWRDQESYKVVTIFLHSLPKQRLDIWPDQLEIQESYADFTIWHPTGECEHVSSVTTYIKHWHLTRPGTVSTWCPPCWIIKVHCLKILSTSDKIHVE